MSISVCLHRKNLIEPPKKSWLPVVSVAERRKWIPDLDSADQKKLDETSPIRKIIVILRIQDSLSRISWNYRTKKMFKINTFFSKLVHFDLKNQNPMCISTCRHRKTQISRKKSFSRISEVFRFTDQFKYITYYRLRQIRWIYVILSQKTTAITLHRCKILHSLWRKFYCSRGNHPTYNLLIFAKPWLISERSDIYIHHRNYFPLII